MFNTLTKKFNDLFSNLTSQKKLTESNIADAIKDVRLALLDADVNYTVTSNFIKRVKEKVIGDTVLKSVSPGDLFIKIIHDELIALMGTDEFPITFKGQPTVILMCGLQGAGKTTQCAKLAAFLQKKEYKKKTLIAACDLQRPAAIEQLKKICAPNNIEVFSELKETSAVQVAKLALEQAKKQQFDVLIIDTAGRLHLDDALMDELKEIKKELCPHEIFFVASSTTGQDAVKTATAFDACVGISGTILTMLDGNSRAGAAISIKEVTNKPLVFEGVGEKIGDLQLFNPKSMADRILGKGDVINLVRKVEEQFDASQQKEMENKILKASFTFEDYAKQMEKIKKMGSLKSLLQMLPGAANLPELNKSEDEFKKVGAIIQSMTVAERQEKVELVPSRRWRIAKGSGTSVDDVNKLVKSFKQMKDLCKKLPNQKDLKKLEKFSWR